MKRYFALAVIMCLLCLGVCLAGCSAKTESTDHTVTFDWKYNGIIDKVPADNGEKVTPPANVYRPNYDFDGWYFCKNNQMTHQPTHFCSYGERKEEK